MAEFVLDGKTKGIDIESSPQPLHRKENPSLPSLSRDRWPCTLPVN